ncbi:MAG: hypothetical protein IJY67_07865 [Paludibacteraceae bacterium]|nr:hypothetical protein [Paludibacteraceae bacterium]
MKNVNFYFMRSIAVRTWMFYVPLFFVVIPYLPLLLSVSESVKLVLQLISWTINILFFMVIVAIIMKDNIEINKNKERNISLFDCFIVISFFFFILIYVPISHEFNRLVDFI